MATTLTTYFPFDAGAGADVTESGWRDMARHWLATGVIDGEDNEFAVSQRAAGANMSVDVATGKCWIRGHYGAQTSVVNLAIATADGTNPRIDRVVLRADFVDNVIELDVLTGTPAGSPAVPALTQSSSVWEISLAQVSVPALDTTIADAQITSERQLRGNRGTIVVRATADESRTSNVSRTAHAELRFALAASETWVGEFVLFIEAGAEAGDIALLVAGPAGSSGSWGMAGLAASATTESGDMTAYSDLVNVSAGAFGIDATFETMAVVRFSIANGATAGTVTLNWAQASSNATPSTIKVGSYLIAHRVP